MNLNLNILNSKALERQIKVVEGRIAELQKELQALERVRAACRILLGEDTELPTHVGTAQTASTATPAPAKKAKPAKAPRPVTEVTALSEDQLMEIESYLMERDTEAETDELIEALRESEFPFEGDASTLRELLRAHQNRFLESGNGWAMANPKSSASFEVKDSSLEA
jgi:hypothetical protein